MHNKACRLHGAEVAGNAACTDEGDNIAAGRCIARVKDDVQGGIGKCCGTANGQLIIQRACRAVHLNIKRRTAEVEVAGYGKCAWAITGCDVRTGGIGESAGLGNSSRAFKGSVVGSCSAVGECTINRKDAGGVVGKGGSVGEGACYLEQPAGGGFVSCRQYCW